MEPAVKCPWPGTLGGPREAAFRPEGNQSRIPAHWSELKRGDIVTLFVSGQGQQSGVVDAVAADAAVLWVVLSGGRGRRLFLQDDVHRTLVQLHDHGVH